MLGIPVLRRRLQDFVLRQRPVVAAGAGPVQVDNIKTRVESALGFSV